MHKQDKKTKKIQFRKSVDELDSRNKGNRQAIAIKYDIDKSKAPKIIATGRGNIADKILEVAEENNIPFYEDQSLADLLSRLEIDQEVPSELYSLVAEVLAFVYQLDRMAKKRQLIRKKKGKMKKSGA